MTDFTKLVEKAQLGDKDAFGKIYTELYTPVFKYVFSRTRHRQTAEDIVGDVFVRFYSSINSYESQKDTPLSYLYTISKNLIINNGKKKKAEIFEEGFEENIKDETKNQLDEAILEEDTLFTLGLLEGLVEDQRDVIRLKYISELSTKEVAEILGKSEANVRQLESRGIRKIKEMVENKNYE